MNCLQILFSGDRGPVSQRELLSAVLVFWLLSSTSFADTNVCLAIDRPSAATDFSSDNVCRIFGYGGGSSGGDGAFPTPTTPPPVSTIAGAGQTITNACTQLFQTLTKACAKEHGNAKEACISQAEKAQAHCSNAIPTPQSGEDSRASMKRTHEMLKSTGTQEATCAGNLQSAALYCESVDKKARHSCTTLTKKLYVNCVQSAVRESPAGVASHNN